MMLTALFLPLALLQDPAPAPVPAKDLPKVEGPISPTYPDPARSLGSDRMELRMRRSARMGNVPTVALPPGACVVQDEAQNTPGWKGYRAEVPPQSSLHMRLKGDHEAWFTVKVVGRWGRPELGMLHNRVHTGNPEASFRNLGTRPETVYFIVDTTETSMQGEAYTLVVTPGPLPETKAKK